MKEIGSFIELELPKGREFYKGDIDIARLNTGRAAIWHAFRCTGAKAIWIPYYQCETVRDFLKAKGVDVKYYHQDLNFNPIDVEAAENEAVLLVNYYGIMSDERMNALSKSYPNAIIDNCQAFFNHPIKGAMNVYSCRKFIGVPDGSYVVGAGAHCFVEEYPQCYSSDTSDFLLKRIEYGCEGKGYESRTRNESRIDSEDCMRMSKLTRFILDGTDYENIKKKRKMNFKIACDLFADINNIDPLLYYDEKTVPMVYPLVVEDDNLLKRFLEAKHYQGHWWNYVVKEMPRNTFEHWISRYMIPITIDQRYGEEDLHYLRKVI